MRRIRIPVAAGLALAALAGVSTSAGRADAASFERLSVSVRAHIVDEDSPDADDICDRTASQSIAVQPNTDIKMPRMTVGCDEVKVDMDTVGHINDDGGAQPRFVTVYSDRDCYPFTGCSWWQYGVKGNDFAIWPDTSETQHISFRKSGTMRVDLDVTFTVES
jgi:hypothetical protein